MFQSQHTIISNQYPAWKYYLLILSFILGIVYALPNVFGEDYAVQIAPVKSVQFNKTLKNEILTALNNQNITPKNIQFVNGKYLIKLNSSKDQLETKTLLKNMLKRKAIVALNLASATPQWLSSIGALPMYLGLDLRGGVHFLMDVDMESAINKRYVHYIGEIKLTLRTVKSRYLSVVYENDQLLISFKDNANLEVGLKQLQSKYNSDLTFKVLLEENQIFLTMSDNQIKSAKDYALKQNITTLRNRINELGVAEPVVQQQGDKRIVVELPGVQDTARAKDILGATATLEFRLVEESGDAKRAEKTGYAPNGAKLYHFRDGRPILLKRNIIVSGDNVINAQSGMDTQSGTPQVNVTLNSAGGRKMNQTTRHNIGNRMAVVYIENHITKKTIDGKEIKKRKITKDVINAAVIRGQFSNRFQITGLDNPQGAQDLALLLRSGSLAAPMEIVEERTVGPSLGADNIRQGFLSVVAGFLLVLVIMAWRYKAFGMIANIALILNLVFIVAILSLLQATLTMPGIAGIVLTVGMAVDANVLIFERIREELRNNANIQYAIHAGYEKAFVTIADANITTLLAAIVLFSFGTGSIKGFAITLSIGIITSMLTSIVGTRSAVNALYGNKEIKKLPI